MEDLSGLGEADREAAVRRRRRRGGARGRSTSRAGPLFRAALLRLGDEEHVLLLSMHHIVSDGWSMGVLFRELSALYAAYREGGESPLPELPVQYADYAVWQREQLAGEVLERQLGVLAGAAGGRAGAAGAADGPSRARAVQTYRGATVAGASSPRSCWSGCRRWAGSEGATLYMMLLAAFQVLLVTYAGSEDVVVGSPIAGRTRGGGGGADRLLRQHAGAADRPLGRPDASARLLRRVREATLGAYAHQERAVREAGGRAAAGAQPEPLAALPGDVHAAERRRAAEALSGAAA